MRKYYFVASMALMAMPGLGGGADHVVLTEIAARGGLFSSGANSSEYVEIYNPTGSSVSDLNNYYVTDWASYYSLPTATRDGLLPNLGGGDFLARFPDGTNLPSQGLAVVTANGQFLLDAYFGGSLSAFQSQPGNPQLFEMTDSDAGINAIPNMVSLNSSSDVNAKNLSHTDAGENQFLFYWDGTSDLVQDLDIMNYAQTNVDQGLANGFTPKTGLQADGPDVDLVNSTYLADAGSTENLTTIHASPTDRPYQYARRSLVELGETTSGGNGKTGHDESLEKINITWGGQGETTATATPGVTTLGLSSADQPPLVWDVKTADPFPQAGETITFQAMLTDDVSVVSGIAKVDATGLGFVDIPMVHSGPGDLWTASIVAPANGTVVKWYITATDSAAQTRSDNDYRYFLLSYPGYSTIKIGTPDLSEGDLQFTELHYDPMGGDNHGESEFVEIHNSTNAAIDISNFVVSKAVDEPTRRMIIPEGTSIPAHGYIVVAAFKPLFLISYPGFDPDQVFDFNWPRSSTLGNTADTISLVHPNQVSLNGEPSTPTDVFRYSGMVAGTGAGNTGVTFEVKSEDGANNEMTDWGVGTVLAGTPGRRSSLDNPGAIAITNQGRTIQYPNSTNAIVINADVVSNNTVTVKLHYTTAPGISYTVVPMTISAGNTYTINLGTFPDGTLIKYFVEATDSNGQIATAPAAAAPYIFRIQDTPLTEADLVITEIMADSDNLSGEGENIIGSEFIEIFNKRSTPVDVSFFKVGHTLSNSPYPHMFPEGTVIPGLSYFVFAGAKAVLLEDHPDLDPEMVFDALYVDSIIANGSGTAYVTNLNAINWNEITWQGPGTPMDSVPYQDNAGGWPNTTNNRSFELESALLDNAVPTNWSITAIVGGTPGKQNSVDSNVADWSMY